jgi:hypothetical protein
MQVEHCTSADVGSIAYNIAIVGVTWLLVKAAFCNIYEYHIMC